MNDIFKAMVLGMVILLIDGLVVVGIGYISYLFIQWYIEKFMWRLSDRIGFKVRRWIERIKKEVQKLWKED